MEAPTVLVVDDDQAICDLVCDTLTDYGYTCEVALNADDALAKAMKNHFDVALLDIKLPGKSGMDLLMISKTCFETTAIVMMTAVQELETAVQAMKLGASDYVVKPFTIDKLSTSISGALKNRKRQTSVPGTLQTKGNILNSEGKNNQSFIAMDAIACGVDAQTNYFDFHSTLVTEKVVRIAHRLGIPEKEIEKWAAEHKRLYSERNSYIQSTEKKLGEIQLLK
jgi:DNA-binding response OmpR family regulator